MLISNAFAEKSVIYEGRIIRMFYDNEIKWMEFLWKRSTNLGMN